jgi:cation diffusion facilitator CzcD-associated flavoprotein CzcO
MSWQTELRDRVARALRLLGPEPKPWVVAEEGVDADVLIVGGGQGGLANAFALRRLGITNVLVIDAAPDETRSGVWLNKARMEVLRTPKTATGPELGIPELSFQAWHEAQFGADAFKGFEFIAREEWARYVQWFRDITGIPVQYGTRLRKIEPLERHFRVHLDVGGQAKTLVVREIILVTGIEGCGGPNRPAIITDNLPASLYSHTGDTIDFSAFKGKTIAVLGAGTSAFDAAAVEFPMAARPAPAAMPAHMRIST